VTSEVSGAPRAKQEEAKEKKMSRLDTRTLKDELTSMDRRCLLDLGHPLLNRIAESFVKAAGVSTRRTLLASAALFSFPNNSNRSVALLLIPCISADRRSAGGREGIILHGNRR